MHVAFVHYHARPGGVTRWLKNIALGLIARGNQVTWVLGEPPPCPEEIPPGVRIVIIPPLAYFQQHIDVKTSLAAVTSSVEAIDLWHFLNPFLGKNQTTPALVRHLAKEGWHLVLNFHDFAEDWRIENLSALHGVTDAGAGYPLAHHIGVLCQNPRDLKAVHLGGLVAGPGMALPNPVHSPGASSPQNRTKPEGSPLYLYPGRMIPRKNPGELVLR
ncbi:MAG: hypothetical protein SNJ52_04210, partial [Verrucomicrobiia bacterium]